MDEKRHLWTKTVGPVRYGRKASFMDEKRSFMDEKRPFMDEKRHLWTKNVTYGRKRHLWMKSDRSASLWTKSAKLMEKKKYQP